jgi:hypothetical protein
MCTEWVKRCGQTETSNCGHNSIFAEREEENLCIEWVKRCGQTDHKITAIP